MSRSNSGVRVAWCSRLSVLLPLNHERFSILTCLQACSVLLFLTRLLNLLALRPWSDWIGVLQGINLGLSLLAAIGLSVLIIQSHRRSIRSSDLAILYLTATCILEFVWITVPTHPGSTPFMIWATFVSAFALLPLECQGKQDIWLGGHEILGPEDEANCLSRAFFWWTHDILARGYKKVLNDDDLPPIDRNLASREVRSRIIQVWNSRGWLHTGSSFKEFDD